MTFQDMVLRASQGVLNYLGAIWKETPVDAHEDQQLNAKVSGEALDVARLPTELSSPLELAATCTR